MLDKNVYLRFVLFVLMICCSGIRHTWANQIQAEQVFVHVAKSFYMPGEILWFKAYLSDPIDGKAVNRSHVLYVELLDAVGKSALQTKIELGKDVTNGGSLYIPTQLPTGKYRLVAYTLSMKNQSEKPFVSEELSILNPYVSVGKSSFIDTGKSVYKINDLEEMAIHSSMNAISLKTREATQLTIRTSVENQPVDAELSVSIYKVDALEGAPVSNTKIFSQSDQTSVSKQLNGQVTVAEQRYHQIAFRLTDKITQKGVEYESVYLSVPRKQSQLYTGKTDEDGHVVFYVKDLFGSTQLAISLVNGQEVNVELISPFLYVNRTDSITPSKSESVKEADVFDPNLQELVLEHSLNVQAENSYFSKERSQYQIRNTDSLPFFSNHAIVYHLDDYTRFVLMEEVLREYVSEIVLQKRNGVFQFRVLDREKGSFFNQAPLTLLDGVPVSNLHDLVAYDPLKVEKISIVPNKYYLGGIIYDGLVSVSTYDGQLKDFPLNSHITLIDYMSLDPERLFYSPIHDKEDVRLGHLPDTRNLLYWNPDVRINESGTVDLSFFTSDVIGNYVVLIQGRSMDGNFGSQIMHFSVVDR